MQKTGVCGRILFPRGGISLWDLKGSLAAHTIKTLLSRHDTVAVRHVAVEGIVTCI
jgi:hypothetical protein